MGVGARGVAVAGGMEFRWEGFSWQKNKRGRECGCQWSAGEGDGDGEWVNRRQQRGASTLGHKQFNSIPSRSRLSATFDTFLLIFFFFLHFFFLGESEEKVVENQEKENNPMQKYYICRRL